VSDIARIANEEFLNLIKTAEGTEELVEQTTNYLRLRLREEGFMRRILWPQVISAAELDRAVDHRSPIKIIDIEPNPKTPVAIPIDFRGSTETTYVVGDRYAITFYKIETKEQQFKEGELLTIKMPITQVLQEILLKEIQWAEDYNFVKASDAAAQVSGNNVTVTGNPANPVLDKAHLVKLMQQLATKSLKAETFLIPYSLFVTVLQWDYANLGSDLLKEVTIDGYKYTTLLGKKFIVTIKNDIVPGNVVYCYTEPKFLGHAFTLEEDVKFEIQKNYDLIKFKAWETIGAGIGNANAVAKLTIA
jgi:hypothetical protein